MADFTRAWNEADPADTDLAKFGAQEIREMKVDLKERLAVEHLGGTLVTDPFGMHAFKTKTIAAADSPYTALALDTLLLVNTVAGNITLNLPAAASYTGKPYIVKKISAVNILTIDPNGAETINGYSSLKFKELKTLIIISDGSNWRLITLLGSETNHFFGPHPYRNLLIKATAGSVVSSVDISFESCILKGSQGDYINWLAGSGVCAITTAGLNGLDTGAEAANTWYNIWAVSDGGTLGFVMSLSSTTPDATITTTYPYTAWLGAIRNNGSSDFQEIYQRDNRVLVAAIPPAGGTYIVDNQYPIVATEVDLGAATDLIYGSPPTAKKVDFTFFTDWVAGSGHLIVQTNQDSRLRAVITVGHVQSGVGYSRGTFSVQPNSDNKIEYYVANSGTRATFGIIGWEY